MTFNRFALAVMLALLVAAPAAVCLAVQPAERLLPATTKGFIATQDVEEVRKRFNETQFGEMSHDPLMDPFITDLKKQVREKIEKGGGKLGLTWKDLEGVYGGEVAAALIQPNPQDKLSHATAILIDVTGKKKESDALLKKIEANQTAKKAKRTVINEAGLDIIQYEQPIKAGEKEPGRSFLCLTADQLITSDHIDTMRGILKRLDGKATDTLASVAGFTQSLKRCETAANGVRFHVRWFMEPLGLAETYRASQGARQKRGKDMIKLVQTQGFSAIQGLGGYVYFATDAGGKVKEDRPEILHRTFVYAPPVKGPANAPAKDKYDLAMRMLDFPNSATPESLNPQPWTLPDVAAYLTFNWKMRQAFDFSETLVDAYMDDKGAFKEMWQAKKSGTEGAPLDIYADLLDHLGERATLLSDIKLPVELRSERQLMLFELKNAADTAAIAKTLEKNFKGDEQTKKRPVGEHMIWDVTRTAAEEPPAKKGKAKAKAPVPAQNVPPQKMAFAAYNGHLLYSTHWEFIEEFIKRQEKNPGLAPEADFRRVRAALTALGSEHDSFRFFTRTDQSYRANYDLFKQGKLPSGETLLAGILNSAISGDTAARRKPEFDGSKLPDFDSIKKYLGPGGVYAQSEDNGWWIVGCLLKKQP